MSSRAAEWMCSLQPSAQLPEENLPETLLPQLNETVEDIDMTVESRQLGVVCLEELKRDGLKSLIEGYSRWIMTVTEKSRIGFLVTSRGTEGDLRCTVISAQLKYEEDEVLKWKAFETSPETPTREGEIFGFELCLKEAVAIEETLKKTVQVALCVDPQSLAITLTSRANFLNNEHISALTKHLENKLKNKYSKDEAMVFWERELKEFVGFNEIQYPTLSCTRSVDPQAGAYTRTSTALQVSWEQIDNLAQNHCLKSGVSVVRGAFAYTLAEYMETDRLILGDQDLADMTRDNSINLVPVRVGLKDTAEDFLRRIDEFDQRGSLIPSLPLQTAQEILNIQTTQVPYNAMFAYHQAITSECRDEAQSRDDCETSCDAQIELILSKSDQDHPVCTLSSRSSLMDLPHSELVLKQIDALIAAICSTPTDHFQDLTQLFPKEILSLHSPVVSEEIQKAPLLSPAHWVDHWASSNPDWIGLEIIDEISEHNKKSRTWTYQELARTSDRFSAWLVARKWSKRSIAVCLDRTFAAYCLVLAIWKSGNCYVPIAEDLPEARQLFLLSDSGATAFFVDKRVSKSLLSPENCEVIDIETLEHSESLTADEDVPFIDTNPSDDCYLLYTSGSTGAPKGVLVSRGNLSAFTEAQSDYICRDVPDTPGLKGVGSYLAHASRAFDVHLCEMVLGWRHGLRLVTGQRNMLLDNLFLVLSRFKITHAGFVPSLLEHAGVSAESLPDLRYLGVGGEKISEIIIERFVGKQSISLVNAYGPTEATIGFTSHTVKPWSTVRNIGTAVGNITVHVLEPESANYVKRGQAGELCITGDLVASGYHRRPDAKGFTDHHGQQMYRTGDIVRLMANDCIEYLGRRDSQAKIRGQRLELEEVSIAIRRCASFPINVTSMVTPSPITKRPQLVSFISPSGDRPDTSSSQVSFLKDKYQEWVPKILEKCRIELPAYMVPSVLIPVSSIPVQISGKADNRRLVALYEKIPISDFLLRSGVDEPESATSDSEEEIVEMSPDEKQVRDILCSIIQEDPGSITRATSIFQLGIDSLGSLGVAAKMRQAGFICSAVDILSKPTISQLASMPRSQESSQGPKGSFSENQEAEASRRLAQLDQDFRNSQSQIPSSSISVIRPCLPLQESIVSNSLGSQTPLYVNHIMCRLGRDIKLSNLKLAFEDLMHHSEILRTCFQIMEKKVLQVVLKPRIVSLRWDEVVVSDENVARAIFNKRQTEIAANIIQEIGQKPPFHMFAAASVSEDDPGWLMLSIHHSIFDGASMGIFLNQLHHHYTGDMPMLPVDLSPLYQYMIANAEKDTKSFWSNYLSGYLPGIVEDDEDQGGSYSITTKTLPFKLSSLAKIASEASSTTPIVVETAWAIALAECLNQNDIIFGRVMNGRSIPVDSLEEMLVPLVTTVPGRFRLPSKRSSLLKEAKSHTISMLESLPFQHTPLRAIQRDTQASGPLFNSLISYIATGPPSHGDSILSEMESVMPADYPLALEVQADSDTDTISLRLRISDSLLLDERYGSLVDKVSIALGTLVSDGDFVINAAQTTGTLKKQQPTWDETQWSETERKIRQAVAEVSGLQESQVSKNVSFFALGIDSVISIHLARCLQKDQILDVSPSDILKYPSVGALQNHLQKPRALSTRTEEVEKSLNPDLKAELLHSEDSILETYPCTPLQTAMIGECLSSEGKGYLHHHVVALSDSVNLERLFNAWQDIRKDADILRTSFHRQGSNSQIQAAVHGFSRVQWSHQPSVPSLPQAIEIISREASYHQMEDFNKPPWFVTLLTGSSQQLMVVTMHHSLYDGFSLPLLFASLERRYHGIPDSLGSFAPIARRITSNQDPSLKFWLDSVTGYQYPGMPMPVLTDSTKPDVRWAEITLQTPILDLQRQCGTLDVTLQTVALLSFARSLMPILGQRDVVFGHVVSGRSFDIESSMSVIGPLFNTVPFRLKLESAHESVRSKLQEIQRFSIDSQPFQHAPLGLVQRDWRKTNNGNGSSLFDALFTFNKSTKFDNESIFQPYESSRQPDTPHYRLNVEFDQSEDSLTIRAVSRDLLTESDGLEDWIKNLADGIENILSSCDASVLSYPPGIDALPTVANHSHTIEDLEQVADSPILETYIEGLKKILCGVIQTAPELIHENTSVFALGLDSILALDVSSQCTKADLKISVGEILQGETIRGIAKLASKKITASPGPVESVQAPISFIDPEARTEVLSALSLAEEDVEIVIPCLSGQNFYIASWLRSQKQLWEFSFALKSRVRLEPDRMEHAWQQLQQRHGILRTAFVAIRPAQVLQVVQKSSDSGTNNQMRVEQAFDDIELFARDLAQKVGRNPSTLFTPPARLHLIQHQESDALLLTLHHALYDARTISILLRDLEAFYHGVDLSPAPSFTSFALGTQQKYQSGYADGFWKNALSMGQRTVIGSQLDYEQTPFCVLSSQALFPQNLAGVESRCREKNISMPSLIMLVVARGLARTANVSHPVLGLFQHGRSNDYPGIQDIAGPTVNLLPLVVQDALATPSRENLVNMQQNLAQRALYDQADVRDLCEGMKALGQDIEFNLLVNILWSQVDADPLEENDTIFSPLSLESEARSNSHDSASEATSVDRFKWQDIPGVNGLYLEVSHQKESDTLLWKLDYTAGSLSREEAEEFLNRLKDDMSTILEQV